MPPKSVCAPIPAVVSLYYDDIFGKTNRAHHQKHLQLAGDNAVVSTRQLPHCRREQRSLHPDPVCWPRLLKDHLQALS